MSNHPTISVITPSYNQAEFIEQAIESVLSQEYPNVEYIIVDGGSTDGSVKIIRRYERHLAYWVSEPDRGQSHAINKGLSRARGDLLAYLNSDDYYLPGSFHAVAELCRDNPDAGLLHGRCRYVDEHGNRIGSQFGPFEDAGQLLDLWDVWWRGRQVVQPEVFWTRAAYDALGDFREDLNYVMDYDYWLRILLAGFSVARRDVEFTAFRFQPNQKSEQSDEVAAELLSLVRERLWDPQTPINSRLRRRLQGEWIYSTRFLPAVSRCVEQGAPKSRRWAELAFLLGRHPQLLLSNAFRDRLRSIS